MPITAVIVAAALLATAPQAVRVIEASPAPTPPRTGQVDETVCRVEPVTGSRFGRRVCRSVRPSDARMVNRETLRRLQGVREPDRGG